MCLEARIGRSAATRSSKKRCSAETRPRASHPLFLYRRGRGPSHQPGGTCLSRPYSFGGTSLSGPLSRIGSWIRFRRARQACPSKRFLGGTCLSGPHSTLDNQPNSLASRQGQFMNGPYKTTGTAYGDFSKNCCCGQRKVSVKVPAGCTIEGRREKTNPPKTKDETPESILPINMDGGLKSRNAEISPGSKKRKIGLAAKLVIL